MGGMIFGLSRVLGSSMGRSRLGNYWKRSLSMMESDPELEEHEWVKFNPESVVEYSESDQQKILGLLEDVELTHIDGSKHAVKSFYQSQGACFVWLRHFS